MNKRILPRSFWQDLNEAIWQPFGLSLLLVFCVCWFVAGFLYITHSTLNLQSYGLTYLLGGYSIGLDREMVPFLVAVVLLLTAGVSFSSELANMKASEQIDLLEMTGLGSLDYLLLPRLGAGLLLTIGLTIAGWVFAFIDCYLVCLQMNVDMPGFLKTAHEFFRYSFVWIGLIKAALNGLVIGLVPSLIVLCSKINNSLDVRRSIIMASAISFILLIVVYVAFAVLVRYPEVLI
jgi:phospholipid/cholesterol/gamma-HCH transport system permease protein